MNQKPMNERDGGIEGGSGDALGGSGGTLGGGEGVGPVAPNGSSQPETAHSGLEVMDGVQVNLNMCVCCGRSKNANSMCECADAIGTGTGPGLNITNCTDTDIQNKPNNSWLDFNSTNENINSISFLNETGFNNSNVNYADITYVNIPINNTLDNDTNFVKDESLLNADELMKELEKGQDTNENKKDVDERMDADENDKGETEKHDKEAKEECPKKKRLSNSERRWLKKCKLEEEKGKAIMEKNKKKPMSELQTKVNEAYKKKLSYAECTKTHEMLEVRSSDLDIMLDQPDFDKIDRELLYRYAGMEVNDDPDNFDGDENESEDEEDDEDKALNKSFYGLVGGISQGCCWFACDNEETAAFVKKVVPTIIPPSPYADKYKYVVYSASQKPFRYMKCKIPKKMWDTKKRLQFLFRTTNNCLKNRVPDEANPGKTRLVRFKIVAGCHNYNAEIVNDRFFWIQIEVDELLMPILTGNEHRGALKLGASPITLIGGGIVSETKRNIEKQMTQHLDDIVSQELRG